MERLQYDKFARIDAEHWWFEARREIADAILTRIHPGGRASIVDIGAGTGGMVPVLSKHGELTVYEPDEKTLKFTVDTYQGRFPKVRFVCGSLDNLNDWRGQFDILTAFDVLEHCQDDAAALQQWCALLKPGGQLLITVPALQCLWGANDELSQHYRRYTKSMLTRLFDSAGLASKVSYMNCFSFLPAWLSRNVKEPMDRLIRGGKPEAPWDFSLPPKPLNNILHKAFAWEKNWLPTDALPFGTSLIAVVTLPSAPIETRSVVTSARRQS